MIFCALVYTSVNIISSERLYVKNNESSLKSSKNFSADSDNMQQSSSLLINQINHCRPIRWLDVLLNYFILSLLTDYMVALL